jgi:hypothetical protein
MVGGSSGHTPARPRTPSVPNSFCDTRILSADAHGHRGRRDGDDLEPGPDVRANR